MQIYCDESGGSSRTHPGYLVAAVAIQPRTAARIMKHFRDETRIPGEIKGYKVLPTHRQRFFDRLSSAGIHASVIMCQRKTSLGDWAFVTLPSSQIYTRLLVEACCTLPVRHQHIIRIVCDRGAYKRTVLERVRDILTGELREQWSRSPVLEYGDSHEHPGLQIADIIANSVYQTLYADNTLASLATMIDSACRAQWLSIRQLCLKDLRPEWLG